MHRAAILGCLITALAGAGPPARAAGLEVNATVSAATDYYFRGVSQTDNEPALQAAVEVEHPSGWFAGLFGSRVRLPNGYYGRERDLELDAHLGYGHELGRGWAAVASAVRYSYPGGGRSYDYDELGIGLEYRGITASVGATDEALGYGGSGRIWELVGRQPLPWHLVASAGVGRYELAGLDRRYLFWHAAVRRPLGRFAADLGYYGSDHEGQRLFGRGAEGRLVLGVSYGVH